MHMHMHVRVCMCKSAQSRLTLCNPMDYGPQAPLSMGFSRQEYWSGLPCSSPWELTDPGVEPTSVRSSASVRSPVSPALQADSKPAELIAELPVV